MKAQPLYSLNFTADLSNINTEFAQGRVAVELGNTSGLGTSNTWCEVRKEPSNVALAYHVFEAAEQAAQYCEDFGTKSETSPEAARRWDYIMRGVA
jgi:hypothetical protein